MHEVFWLQYDKWWKISSFLNTLLNKTVNKEIKYFKQEKFSVSTCSAAVFVEICSSLTL